MAQERSQQVEELGQVTIVGNPGVGKYTLVCRLLHPVQPHGRQSTAAQLWHLNTKYYTTKMQINRHHPSAEAQQQANTSQGLVLVFDATSEATFLDVSRWAEQLPDSAAEIRLCIANKVDQLHEQQNGVIGNPILHRTSWLQEAATWCAEHQFEYIEASSTDPQLDGTLVHDEQKQGVSRVISALEANYWPGLVMKRPQLQTQTEQQNGHANGNSASASNGTRHVAEDATSPSKESGADFAAFDSFQSAEEADLDQYEKMFGELRATRERIQDLPREQRQSAAADMALRIAAVLGLEEEDSSDEEHAGQ